MSRGFETVEGETVEKLKCHLLDALGSLIHARVKPAIGKMIAQIQTLGEGGKCRVLGLQMPADRASQLYTALIRYPDFMDNYLGKEATCHPSDNLGPLLAMAGLQCSSGKDFLAAMAVAYQIECRLVEEIPVMKEGIDHTLFLSYSMVASVARLMKLSEEQTAHALGIAGCSISPMATSRASYTYEWKGFASSFVALNAVNAVFLAREGMTGPIALFEGPKGFDEIFGMNLEHDWSKEDFSLIRRCVLKAYNAEVHTQSAIEAALELKEKHQIAAENIKEINITTFLTAYHITGSGAYGDRKTVETKEQADHSMFYVVAVALLDNEVYPRQFEPSRIRQRDVQALLKKVKVHTGSPLHKPVTIAGVLDSYTRSYPDEVKTKVEIALENGDKFSLEKTDHAGFHTRPFTWTDTIEKFLKLTDQVCPERLQSQIVDVVRTLENRPLGDLLEIFNQTEISLTTQTKAQATLAF